MLTAWDFLRNGRECACLSTSVRPTAARQKMRMVLAAGVNTPMCCMQYGQTGQARSHHFMAHCLIIDSAIVLMTRVYSPSCYFVRGEGAHLLQLAKKVE